METMTKLKWIIDPTHSEIGFKIKHLMITNVKGNFRRFEASIYTSGEDFRTAEADCWIDVNSIDTGNSDRDRHVKSADFFDAENHPQIGFRLTEISPVDQDGSYEIWGDLSIRGTTKKVKLSAEFGGVMKDPWGAEKAGFAIHGNINRKDFGLNWNAPLEAGGFLVSDVVYINCELQLMRSE